MAVKSFLLNVWILIFFLGFAPNPASGQGCQVRWKKPGFLKASACVKRDNYFIVQPCGTELVCKAKTENIKPDAHPCENSKSPSAPTFEAFRSNDLKLIKDAIESTSSLPRITISKKDSDDEILKAFSQITAGKMAPAILLQSDSSDYLELLNRLEYADSLPKKLAKAKVNTVYLSALKTETKLTSFSIDQQRLRKAEAPEPMSCGDE